MVFRNPTFESSLASLRNFFILLLKCNQTKLFYFFHIRPSEDDQWKKQIVILSFQILTICGFAHARTILLACGVPLRKSTNSLLINNACSGVNSYRYVTFLAFVPHNFVPLFDAYSWCPLVNKLLVAPPTVNILHFNVGAVVLTVGR